jgi:protein subunit release factor B|tara:strand:+ start:448 stop:729 length:282 start_codon:yes stop_codon:yes gene_type:complete
MKKYLNNVLVDLTEEEKSQKETDIKNWETLENNLFILRQRRNSLLAKTDWTASSDVTMSDKMKTYRQQLRDATNGLDTIEKVKAYSFPTEVDN